MAEAKLRLLFPFLSAVLGKRFWIGSRAGKPCRLALMIVSLVVIIFIGVEQASEMLRCLGEGPAHTRGVRREQFLSWLAGLTALSLCAWYMSRVLLYLQFIDSPKRHCVLNQEEVR